MGSNERAELYEYIDEIEQRTFIEYAKEFGYEPDVLARKLLSFIKESISQYEKSSGHRNVSEQLFLTFEESPVAALINANRKFAIQKSGKIIDNLMRFVMKAPRLFGIDHHPPEKRKEILSKLRANLESVPLMILFTNRPEAYVEMVRDTPQCVVVSKTLSTITEIFLFRVLINLIIPKGKIVVQSRDYPETSSNADPVSVEKAAELIANLAKMYVSNQANTRVQESALVRATEASVELGYLMHIGSQDFIFYHEYAHVLTGRTKEERDVKTEVEADMIALNVLLSEKSNTGDSADFSGFKAIGVMGLFLFLWLVEEVAGVKHVNSHPLAITRFKYIYLMALVILSKRAKEISKPFIENLFRLFAESASCLGIGVEKNFGPNPKDLIFLPHEKEALKGSSFYGFWHDADPGKNILGFYVK